MPRPATLYRIANDCVDNLPTLAASDQIPVGLKRFTQSLINCCTQNVESEITRVQLIEFLKERDMPVSDGAMNLRLKELLAVGALQHLKIRRDGRSFNVYNLHDINQLFVHFAKEKRQALVPGRRRSKTKIVQEVESLSERATYLSVEDDAMPRIESLFCILDSSMKLSGRDKRSVIECEYHFSREDYIHIKTTTSTGEGSEIAHLADERAMRALNAMLLEHIENTVGLSEQQPLSDVEDMNFSDGYLVFDIYDLCKRMGLRPTVNNRNIARRMVERLKDTTFSVDASHSNYFRDHYLPDKSLNVGEYRYITEFFARKEEELIDEEQKVYSYSERFYFVRFNSLILANLRMVGRSFISHPALASERSGLAHRLNNWAKAVVGVRPSAKSKDTHCYALDEFRDRVMPSARLDNFERDFLNLVSKQSEMTAAELDTDSSLDQATGSWNDEAINVVWIYGYYYKIEHNPQLVRDLNRRRGRRARTLKDYPVITIWRDGQDAYVGDDSPHNQALRRQASVVLANG